MSTEELQTVSEVDKHVHRNHEVHHLQPHLPSATAVELGGASHHVIHQLNGSEGTATRHLPATTFQFAEANRSRALARSGGAIVLTAISVFLLSEISATPALRMQMYLVGAIGLVSAAVLTALAARDFFGALTIDGEGIAVTPKAMGFTVPWSAIRTWAVRLDPSGSPAIMLKLYGTEPRSIPIGLLTESQLSEVWKILRSQAITKESA